jgi:predicted HTH domain antitoxin
MEKLEFININSFNDTQEIKQALKKMTKKEIVGIIVELVEEGKISLLDLAKLKGRGGDI